MNQDRHLSYSKEFAKLYGQPKFSNIESALTSLRGKQLGFIRVEDNMGDKTKGLYKKYRVERTDGTDQVGEKHFGCWYYVLDVNHDPYALPALEAYANACAKEYPLLAKDLHKLVLAKKQEIEDLKSEGDL